MSAVAASLATSCCPLCGGGLSAVQVEAALHLVQCGARCLEESGAKVVASRGADADDDDARGVKPRTTTPLHRSARGKAKEEPREDEEEDKENEDDEEKEEDEVATPKRKRSSAARGGAKTAKNEAEEEEEVELTPNKKKSRSSSSSGKGSPGTPTRRSFASEEDYDAFLLSEKKGRFVRVGSWTGMSKGILHR
jgi:hypothetical protein